MSLKYLIVIKYGQLYSFPWDALNWVIERIESYSLRLLETRYPKLRCQHIMFSSKALSEDLCLSLPCFWLQLAILCLQTHQSYLCLCLHIICSFCISVCSILHVYSVLLCLCVFPSSQGYQSYWFRAHGNLMRSHVSLITSTKAYF